MSRQKTIANPVSLKGLGLFGGVPCNMRFAPAPADSGLAFIRCDLQSPVRIAVRASNVVKNPRRTSLVNGPAAAETVEHVLAAIWGCGIDNLSIEIDGPEIPSIDGSPLPFIKVLQTAGVKELDAPRSEYIITEPVAVSEGDAMLAALPGPTDCLEILYELDDLRTPSIGKQVLAFRLDKEDFITQIAPARTFMLEAEALEAQAQGLGKHLSAKDLLVMGPSGPIDNTLRFPDEHVRHKVVDLVGDMSLLGKRLRGRIVACRSGHALNHALVRKLLEVIARGARGNTAGEPILDIRKIMRILKHRYPFLMVDRVLEIDGDRRAVGVKNVTMNEPFFQGHFPGQPIMPGVMILEALAQLSGILLSRRLEHTGKIAVLLSMDRVKMRRPVRPGDQLVLEAESLHVRTRTGHCRCKAYVGPEVAAEAEIKFMLVDDEPV
ncbi:MAG: UDP-3-O-[3-hydroxymyristoyl] N-acetylglucosamine deacetylase [Planctomycetes bacterium]|nr:UDP-3-O-[3-hydroxymyristoyl] N-acetylglucosamine deacetylase [Planctomycetota bacterium]